MNQLETIIKNLENNENVDAVFLTGSYGIDQKNNYSDIDLVIIFKKNDKNIKSLYTWIDDAFADVFFFDQADLERIEKSEKLLANNMDAIFTAWLEKSSILFDKSGTTTKLKSNLKSKQNLVAIPQDEKGEWWQKINYNFIANKRYFESDNSLYLEALEMRLLYSVIELINGYFEFRDIPWRGEKQAILYLKEKDETFYKIFVEYSNASDISKRFKLYSKLVTLTLTADFPFWTKENIIVQTKDGLLDINEGLADYWKNITSNYDTTLEHIARGIIVEDGKILLCKNLVEGHCFLPGGHVEDNEKPEETLVREMMEESNRSIVEVQHVTTVENEYKRGMLVTKEKFDVYLARLNEGRKIKSKENHISFAWISLQELACVNFKPQKVIPEIIAIVSNNAGFWN
ncbi:MAG: NUDIX domain-containing protein [Candidatus Paceibacterota bacterium]